MAHASDGLDLHTHIHTRASQTQTYKPRKKSRTMPSTTGSRSRITSTFFGYMCISSCVSLFGFVFGRLAACDGAGVVLVVVRKGGIRGWVDKSIDRSIDPREEGDAPGPVETSACHPHSNPHRRLWSNTCIIIKALTAAAGTPPRSPGPGSRRPWWPTRGAPPPRRAGARLWVQRGVTFQSGPDGSVHGAGRACLGWHHGTSIIASMPFGGSRSVHLRCGARRGGRWGGRRGR